MDDKRLLDIARKYENVLIRLEAGLFDTAIEEAIQCARKSPYGSPGIICGAHMLALMKQFVLGGEVLPDLQRIDAVSDELWKRR